MRGFLLVLTVLLPFASGAQPVVAPSLETLEREALAAYPGLEQLNHEVSAAQALEKAAGALPDPMAEVMLTDARFPDWTLGREEMSMLGVMLRQGLLSPARRQGERLRAQAETRVRVSELNALKALLLLQVRQAYARMFRLDAELRVLGQAQDLLAVLAETTRARYTAGLATQESVLKVLLQQSRLAEQRADLQKERAETQALLNRLCNRPQGTAIGEITLLPPVVPPEPSWPIGAQERAPAVQVAWRQVETARREVDLAKAELQPNLFASGGLGTRGAFGAVLTLSFGVEWPLWQEQKQRPKLAAARARLAVAEAQLGLVRAEVQEKAAGLQAAWATAQGQLSRYRDELVPLAETALAAARAAFTSGQGDFSTVVENFNLWLEAQMGLARRQEELFVTWAAIQYLLGDGGGEP